MILLERLHDRQDLQDLIELALHEFSDTELLRI